MPKIPQKWLVLGSKSYLYKYNKMSKNGKNVDIRYFLPMKSAMYLPN